MYGRHGYGGRCRRGTEALRGKRVQLAAACCHLLRGDEAGEMFLYVCAGVVESREE